jgi:hypothetical protein
VIREGVRHLDLDQAAMVGSHGSHGSHGGHVGIDLCPPALRVGGRLPPVDTTSRLSHDDAGSAHEERFSAHQHHVITPTALGTCRATSDRRASGTRLP